MDESNRVNEAKHLVDEILDEARANDHKRLLALASAPETDELLDLLSNREAGQARQHLRAARLWQAQQNERAKSKLDAAARALDELDLPLARGILRKIDSTVLDEVQQARFDGLLLAVEARAMELEDIESKLPPADEKKSSRRFWNR